MKTAEIIAIIKKIRDGATGTDMSLGELLRLCMRLGKALSNEELVVWARSEASGYEDADKLPDYRKMKTEVRGDFSGPFGSGIKNAHIPPSIIDKEHRDTLFSIHFMEPVNQLEEYAHAKGDGMFQSPWPGDAILYYQQKELYTNGMVLVSAHRLMTRQNVAGILETIRTRVLDFVLQIEDEIGIDIDEPNPPKNVDDASLTGVRNVFYNTILGGNVSLSNMGNADIDNINISIGNMDELKNYLSSIGVNDKELNLLEAAIHKEPKAIKGELGPRVSGWLSKINMKVLKGGLMVGKEIGASLIAKAIMLYYGIDA